MEYRTSISDMSMSMCQSIILTVTQQSFQLERLSPIEDRRQTDRYHAALAGLRRYRWLRLRRAARLAVLACS